MAMLESLILSIDRIPPTVAEIRMFPLANADAEEVVEVLENLFEEPTSDEGPETRLQVGAGGTTASLSADSASAPGQELRFTANRRTNMVIAAGSTADLDMIESLVRQLDSQDVEDRIQFVYPTRYVPAADLVAAIRDYFDEENDLLGDIEDEQSIMRQAERHVTVVGDEDSNTVLVGVSPRYYSRTMEMLYAIDRPPPQVVIKVLIAEVQLDDRVEFGMEWALQDLSFSKNATVGPNGIIQGDNFDFVGGTDVGAAGAAGSFGGFTFSITGEDFNFLLRALQSDGSLEVLSRPQITVENNEEANITIGDEVPFLRGSQVTDNGQVNSQVEYEDVGIIVDVTPHINPDGYVNLEIRPEISSLNEGSSVQISENLTAPTFSNRSVETVVTVKDGETVVIGGLIQTQEDLRENKVPIFGDIPYIGNLFRATLNQRRRTELLLVLSVDVINDERDFFEFSQELRDQSGFLPEKMKRSPLMEGLRILPPEEEIDLEDEYEPVRRRRDRDLFGPAPDVYGPQRPVRPATPETPATSEVYGPPRVNRVATPVALSNRK
jgi:type II secretion system protein D